MTDSLLHRARLLIEAGERAHSASKTAATARELKSAWRAFRDAARNDSPAIASALVEAVEHVRVLTRNWNMPVLAVDAPDRHNEVKAACAFLQKIGD